jgi:peptidoglycan/xylan/chitin deacetylase (PgdA/CDA1 family)
MGLTTHRRRNRVVARNRVAAVAVGLALAVVAACQAPASPVPGRTVGALGGTPGQVALTFDDGPTGPYTQQILDILDRYGVKATFFEIGSQVAAHPDISAEIIRRGHSIGNHTWSHVNLTKQSGGGMNDQLVSTQNAIAGATGTTPSCARPPGGNFNGAVGNAIAANNMRPAMWSIDTKDWQKPPAPTIVARALAVQPDGVILMHDGGGDRSQTVAALPAIIEGLQARGLVMTRVCDGR